MLFLLQYNRKRGELVSFKAFPDSEAPQAAEERLKLEVALARDDEQNEVVLLQAPDEAALHRTHRRYFARLHHGFTASTSKPSG